MSDVWGSEAREAVARAICDLHGGIVAAAYLPQADAVLEALTPHAVPRRSFEEKTRNLHHMLRERDAIGDQYDALRAAVLAKAQEWDSLDNLDDSGYHWGRRHGEELRALAGGQP